MRSRVDTPAAAQIIWIWSLIAARSLLARTTQNGGSARDLPSPGPTTLCDQSFDAVSVAFSPLEPGGRVRDLVVWETSAMSTAPLRPLGSDL
jgi:hypothetical protein